MEYHAELVCFTNEYNSLMKTFNQLQSVKSRNTNAMTQKELEANLMMRDALNEKLAIILDNVVIHAETLKCKLT